MNVSCECGAVPDLSSDARLQVCMLSTSTMHLFDTLAQLHPTFASCTLQVIADDYTKLDKELLGFIEDVLLNRCENSTERMLEYAGTLEPKCKPTDVKKLQTDTLPPKLNPIAEGVDPLAVPTDLPPVPEYKAWADPLQKSEAFGQLQEMMEQRIIYIDGAMGTSIQKHK